MENNINLLGHQRWTPCDISNDIQAQFALDWPEWKREKAKILALGSSTTPPDFTLQDALFAYRGGVSAFSDVLKATAALLDAALDYEAAVIRLALPEYDGPETQGVQDVDGNVTEFPHPDFVQDQADRSRAQVCIDSVTPSVLELVEQRKPPVPIVEPEPFGLFVGGEDAR